MRSPNWTDAEVERALHLMSKCRTLDEALDSIARHMGRTMSQDALSSLFTRRGLGSPGSHLVTPARPGKARAAAAQDAQRGGYTGAPPVDLDDEPPFRDTIPGMRMPTPAPVPPPSPSRAERGGELRQKLYDIIKKGPISFAELCDRLDMAPAKARAAIDDARANGLQVHTEHDHVGIKTNVQQERIQDVGIAPIVGERQRAGVISDTHLGSKYCLRAQLRDFVHYAYFERGVREIFHPGDWLDGMYKHGLWEVSHSGLDAQVDDLLEVLPQLPGLNYRGITGNHDETFEDASGISVGDFIVERFRERGRNDVHFYGRRSAYIKMGGIIVHLWHPRGSAAYAKSYRLQKVIEKYSSGEKPHMLLVGHFHQYCHLFDRGIHAFLCPTFQGGGSAFGNSLGGAPTMGGMILEWDLTEHGTMRNFVHEYRSYFEVEQPHRIEANES